MSAKAAPSLAVKDWMHKDVHVIRPHDTIDHARELCERHRVNQLPVVTNGRLMGIVTDRDLRDAFPSLLEEATTPSAAHAETSTMHVEDVMTANVLTVTADQTIAQAAALMKKERVGALPVVSGDRLVGILTRSDLLAALIALT